VRVARSHLRPSLAELRRDESWIGLASTRIKTARQLDQGEPILREEVNLEFDYSSRRLIAPGRRESTPLA
jgi:hypothetical protein